MPYFNRTSSHSADSQPVGAEALKGSGVSVVPAPAAPPAVQRHDPSTAAPPPAMPAYESPSSVAHVSTDRQIQTLQEAAKNGTPFCEECAKPAAAS